MPDLAEQLRKPVKPDRHDWLIGLMEGRNAGKMRVKLAWVGDAYTNYSFVNRQYKVVAERPMYVLAEEFRNNTARVVEDVALFDRAMDGVISGIMKFAKPRTQAGHA